MADYYVYEWIRLDTNEPFYVGKGRDKRWKKINREYNSYFMNIINKVPVAVNILHDELDEETAFGLECYYIWLYRDEIGYDLCNITDGGEGCTLYGELNPFYGRCHSEETKEKIRLSKLGKPLSEETKRKVSENNAWKNKKRPEHSEKMKGKMLGKNNPMFEKNPLDYMTEEAKNERRKKISENNAKYWEGKTMSEEHRKKISDATKGKNNPRAKSVICLTTGKIFSYAREGAEYYGIKNASLIGQCCKGKYKSCGKLSDGTPLKWKFIKWNHDKRYRIKRGDA